jgi:hypothetical protein
LIVAHSEVMGRRSVVCASFYAPLLMGWDSLPNEAGIQNSLKAADKGLLALSLEGISYAEKHVTVAID